jgi:hypothetical protein
MRTLNANSRLNRQRGAAIVEFAIIFALFIAFIYAIFEFGRMLFIYSSMQEISRRGARAAAIHSIATPIADRKNEIRKLALFGAEMFPGGPEIGYSNVSVRYLRADKVTEITDDKIPVDAGDNLSACVDATRSDVCIKYIEVSVQGVSFTPLIFKAGAMKADKTAHAMPDSTVIVYAESLGFTN